MGKFVALVALVGCGLAGCGSGETSVTKDEEEAFRNPPKEIPEASLKAMQKGREEGARMAAEAQRKQASTGR